MNAGSNPRPITIGSWLERLGATSALLIVGLLAGTAGPRTGRTSAAAVIAFYSIVALLCAWWLQRICRMGVRFDQEGVTFHGLIGRPRRFSWQEVSRLSDSEASVIEPGGSSQIWALEMVLKDGRKLTVPGTARMPWSGNSKQPIGLPKLLSKVEQVAERYQIPAYVAGAQRGARR